jgi:hypothetical protein
MQQSEGFDVSLAAMMVLLVGATVVLLATLV